MIHLVYLNTDDVIYYIISTVTLMMQSLHCAYLDTDDVIVTGAPVAPLHGVGSCHHMFPHALRRACGGRGAKFNCQ